jgi:CHAD domain-containing protein
MAESFFDKLQIQAYRAGLQPRTKESQDWFRDKLKNMRNINRQRLLKDPTVTRTQRPRMGDMYMFFYDPKHKDTLPYYDTFPLIIMVERAPGGFYGLNLHYLPPVLRAKLFDALSLTNDKYDESTRFKARYRMLKSVRKLRYFKPCFKHYLTEHIESRIAKVEPTEWEVAMFMQTQRFKKSTASNIYRDSRQKLRA